MNFTIRFFLGSLFNFKIKFVLVSPFLKKLFPVHDSSKGHPIREY